MRNIFKRSLTMLLVCFVLTASMTVFAAPKAQKMYKSGKFYLVGVDIPEGEYYAKAKKGEANFQIHDSDSGDADTSLMTRTFEGSAITIARRGDYIYFENCDVYMLYNAPKIAKDKKGAFPAGTYKLGSMITENRVLVTPIGGDPAYVELWADCTYTNSSRIDAGYVYEPRWLSLPKNGYFYVENGTVKPKDPMLKDFGITHEQFMAKFSKTDSNWKRFPFELMKSTSTKKVYSVYENFDIEIITNAKTQKVLSVMIKSYVANGSKDIINNAINDLDHYVFVIQKCLLPKMTTAEMDNLYMTLDRNLEADPNSPKHIYAYRESYDTCFQLGIYAAEQPFFVYFEIFTPSAYGG